MVSEGNVDEIYLFIENEAKKEWKEAFNHVNLKMINSILWGWSENFFIKFLVSQQRKRPTREGTFAETVG